MNVRSVWSLYYRFTGLRCHKYTLYLCCMYIYMNIYLCVYYEMSLLVKYMKLWLNNDSYNKFNCYDTA